MMTVYQGGGEEPVEHCERVINSHSVMSNSLQLHGLLPARLLCP